jgi:hypothetical protein
MHPGPDRTPVLSAVAGTLTHVTDYDVQITEIIEPISDPSAPTPVVRDVKWRGPAESADAAKIEAWSTWDETYGPRRQPAEAIVLVTEIAATPRT